MIRKFCALIVVAFLAACANSAPPPPCPAAGLLPGASALPVFADMAAPDSSDIKVQAEILNFRGGCKVRRDGTQEFILEIDFRALLSEKHKDMKGLSLPYFVAVLASDEKLLQRERFKIKHEFDNTGLSVVTEEHVITLPGKTAETAGDFKIAFGFELTSAQLDYNRRR